MVFENPWGLTHYSNNLTECERLRTCRKPTWGKLESWAAQAWQFPAMAVSGG